MKRIVEVQIREDQVNPIAATFINTANKYSSYIQIAQNGNRVNAKSLLGFLSLGLRKGVHVELNAEGADAEESLEALAALLEQRG
ncbi:MAG: HPr family phosphocarrier protein [Oscillibacter sp.]|nr:HPr family phosphocarrier protein [Oscillibacter sp.]